jgi:cyclophilin family peptidyl-prolyl cis-trans isomerase
MGGARRGKSAILQCRAWQTTPAARPARYHARMTFRRRLLAALLCCLGTGLAVAATRAATPANAGLLSAEPSTAPSPPAPPAPRVALETSLGRIVLELFPQRAPKTVANFLEYTKAGHYNGTVFHRAIYGVLVQGGGFTPDLQAKPERQPVENEAGNGLSNTRGTLAAARRPSVADSAGAQFFINLGDNPGFDRHAPEPPEASGYTVFGRVIDGLDVADRIAALPTAARAPFDQDVPVTPVIIERAEVLPPAPAAPEPIATPPRTP